MAILDDLKDMAKTARDSAEDLFETTKLNSRIGDEQRRITRCKAQLGEYIWQQYAAGQEDGLPAGALDICREIDGANARVAKWTAEINNIKTQTSGEKDTAPVCRVCGGPLRADDRFCSRCGAEQQQPEGGAEQAQRQCPVCGGEVAEGAAFCGKCGAAQ